MKISWSNFFLQELTQLFCIRSLGKGSNLCWNFRVPFNEIPAHICSKFLEVRSVLEFGLGFNNFSLRFKQMVPHCILTDQLKLSFICALQGDLLSLISDSLLNERKVMRSNNSLRVKRKRVSSGIVPAQLYTLSIIYLAKIHKILCRTLGLSSQFHNLVWSVLVCKASNPNRLRNGFSNIPRVHPDIHEAFITYKLLSLAQSFGNSFFQQGRNSFLEGGLLRNPSECSHVLESFLSSLRAQFSQNICEVITQSIFFSESADACADFIIQFPNVINPEPVDLSSLRRHNIWKNRFPSFTLCNLLG
ncbi:hypothetical protein D9M71_385870 [compost metagenome]